MTAAVGVRFEDVHVGDPIAPIAFRFTLKALVKYAAATWDFHPYHYDAAFVQKLGMPAPVVDGQMLGALMARLLMSWGGTDAFLTQLAYRQRTPLFVEDEVSISGRVVSKTIDAGLPLVNVVLTITKSDGVVIVSDATATIELTGPGLMAGLRPSEEI